MIIIIAKLNKNDSANKLEVELTYQIVHLSNHLLHPPPPTFPPSQNTHKMSLMKIDEGIRANMNQHIYTKKK